MAAPARGTKARFQLHEVLAEELRVLRGKKRDEATAPPTAAVQGAEAPDSLSAAYKRIARLSPPLSALCLSGGGIRSATFNLGVLQALARSSLLSRFDYLSTVSGGGYIGSWLQAWIHRTAAGGPVDRTATAAPAARAPDPEAMKNVLSRLARPLADEAGLQDPLRPEPRPIDRLREFSNYLTPRKGLGSGDTWALAAIVLRNLLLNWLVILPIIAVVLLGPLLLTALVEDGGENARAGWADAATWIAVALGLLASAAIPLVKGHGPLPARAGEGASTHRGSDAPPPPSGGSGGDPAARRDRAQLAVVLSTGGLLVPVAFFFFLAALWAVDASDFVPGFAGKAEYWGRVLRLSAWTVGVPAMGWTLGSAVRLGLQRWRARRRRPGGGAPAAGAATRPGRHGRLLPRWKALVIDAFALLVAGGVTASILAGLLGLDVRAQAVLHAPAVALLAVPILLLAVVAGRPISAAISSVKEDWGRGTPAGDADREWWARVIGRVLAAALIWAGVSFVVLYGSGLLDQLWSRIAVLGVGGVSGIVTALLGKGEETGSGRNRPPRSRSKELVMNLAAILAVTCAFAVLASALAQLGTAVEEKGWFPSTWPLGTEFWSLLAIAVLLLGISTLAGACVNVNRFSLHRMYRNRLVRAYLGASNVERRPDPSSGFDPADGNVLLRSCIPRDGQHARLVPIVNCTLNLLRGRLGWQERQAESFSMTPFFCGNFYEGYRRTKHYGSPSGGITLGSAMAISGAAANPNMGYVSSPLLTFLLALLNARLGVWLANPNERGDGLVSRRGPRHATAHLLCELLGRTNRTSRFVNLSDGGHFDNLGLYEVVLRRCRVVVVSDASRDPGCGFDALGCAIRKIRVDFGIPVEIVGSMRIRPRGREGSLPRGGSYCAVAKIRYSRVDGTSRDQDGTLVYFKPTLAPAGRRHPLPADVVAYARTRLEFPHESTADQWFSESQFESYRALGEHLMGVVVGDHPLPGIPAFLQRVHEHLRISKRTGRANGDARRRPPPRPSHPPDRALWT